MEIHQTHFTMLIPLSWDLELHQIYFYSTSLGGEVAVWVIMDLLKETPCVVMKTILSRWLLNWVNCWWLPTHMITSVLHESHFGNWTNTLYNQTTIIVSYLPANILVIPSSWKNYQALKMSFIHWIHNFTNFKSRSAVSGFQIFFSDKGEGVTHIITVLAKPLWGHRNI